MFVWSYLNDNIYGLKSLFSPCPTGSRGRTTKPEKKRLLRLLCPWKFPPLSVVIELFMVPHLPEKKSSLLHVARCLCCVFSEEFVGPSRKKRKPQISPTLTSVSVFMLLLLMWNDTRFERFMLAVVNFAWRNALAEFCIISFRQMRRVMKNIFLLFVYLPSRLPGHGERVSEREKVAPTRNEWTSSFMPGTWAIDGWKNASRGMFAEHENVLHLMVGAKAMGIYRSGAALKKVLNVIDKLKRFFHFREAQLCPGQEMSEFSFAVVDWEREEHGVCTVYAWKFPSPSTNNSPPHTHSSSTKTEKTFSLRKGNKLCAISEKLMGAFR